MHRKMARAGARATRLSFSQRVWPGLSTIAVARRSAITVLPFLTSPVELPAFSGSILVVLTTVERSPR